MVVTSVHLAAAAVSQGSLAVVTTPSAAAEVKAGAQVSLAEAAMQPPGMQAVVVHRVAASAAAVVAVLAAAEEEGLLAAIAVAEVMDIGNS